MLIKGASQAICQSAVIALKIPNSLYSHVNGFNRVSNTRNLTLPGPLMDNTVFEI